MARIEAREAEALRRNRPDLHRYITEATRQRRKRAHTFWRRHGGSIEGLAAELGIEASAAGRYLSGELTKRQAEALSAWERCRDVQRVAGELGISVSAARQLLAMAGAMRTRPGFERRQAVALLKQGAAPAEVERALRLHPLSLELAIRDYAVELLARERGADRGPATSPGARRPSAALPGSQLVGSLASTETPPGPPLATVSPRSRPASAH